MDNIILENVCKSFNQKKILNDFSAVFPAGKTTCIMGPSGSGKTTLLRILMGLENADSGKISGLDRARKSAVFQEDRLCDYLTPVANIRLVNPRLCESEILLGLADLGLSGCEAQPVRELSGGMRRRVALLRALLAEYDVLFLDEPFKGLDEDTRAQVIQKTRASCASKTVLLVTHAPEEAEAMGAKTGTSTIYLTITA